MTTEDKNIYDVRAGEQAEPASETPEQMADDDVQAAPRKSGVWPIVAFVLAAAAWIALAWNGYVALGISFVALVASFIAIRRRRGAWRNLAITSLIASGVLFVIVTAFIIVIFVGLKSM